MVHGLKAYSTDLLRDTNLELRDVLPGAADAPYGFIGAPAEFNHESLLQMMRYGAGGEHDVDAVYRVLLWFGFIGIIADDGEAKYIYSFSYDHKLLLASISRLREHGMAYQVNPAFWSALGIQGRPRSA